jgi:hypothetical protein
MNIKDKIKYEMITFLNKRCNRSTVQIEINGCETRYENAIHYIEQLACIFVASSE